MTFSIRFTDRPSGVDGLLLGEFTLNDDTESFSAAVDTEGGWTQADYEMQWRDGLKRIVDGKRKSCLVTSLAHPTLSDAMFYWPMYRAGEEIVFHARLVLLDQLPRQFDPAKPYKIVPDKPTKRKVSEWRISFADIVDCYERMATRPRDRLIDTTAKAAAENDHELRNVPGAHMDQQLWHVVWATFGEWPPHDQRGDWTELSELYAPLVAAGSAAASRPLRARYREQSRDAIVLSQEDATQLCEWLLKLTRDGGDRVAGGHPVSAAAFGPTQAHMLLRCERDRLGQVVGRIKSRLAALLLFERRWSNKGHRIWSRGFWAAELLNDDVGQKAKTFIASADIYSRMVPGSERPQYFHPEELSRAALEAEFACGDADRIYKAFLNAAYFDDAAWVQAKAIEALASPVAVVRWGALAALQILAAVHRELDPNVVVPAVMPLIDDPDKDVRWVAKDVLSDIKHIFGQ